MSSPALRFAELFPDVLCVNNDGLFCRLCKCRVSTKSFELKLHFKTSKHKAAEGEMKGRGAEALREGQTNAEAQSKSTRSSERFVSRIVQLHPSVLCVNRGQLFCKLCKCSLSTRIFNIQKHFNTIKHRNAESCIYFNNETKVDNDEDGDSNASLDQPRETSNFVSNCIRRYPNVLREKDDGSLYCQLCDTPVSLRMYNIRKHFDTFKHKAAARASETSKEDVLKEEALKIRFKLPKLGENFVSRCVELYPNVLATHEGGLYCKLCECSIASTRRLRVWEHFDSAKHKAAAAKNGLLPPTSLKEDEDTSFPLKKPKLEEGFETQCNQIYPDFSCKTEDCMYCDFNSLPTVESREDFSCGTTSDEDEDESLSDPLRVDASIAQNLKSLVEKTTTKQHVTPSWSREDIESLRQTIANKPIQVMFRESQKDSKLSVVTISLCILEKDKVEKGFFLNSKTLPTVNASTMAAFFVDSLQKLWPNGIKYDQLLAVVTDASPHIAKAMDSFQVLFPKMLHFTCFAEGLHKVADAIKYKYPLVGSLITGLKTALMNIPSLQSKFEQQNFSTLLRYNVFAPKKYSWLDAAIYNCENFNAIRSVMESCGDLKQELIEICKLLYKHEDLKTQLATIKTKFSPLAEAIKELETHNLKLNSAISVINGVEVSLEGEHEISEAFKDVFAHDPGYESLSKINSIMEAAIFDISNDYIKNLSPSDLIAITLCRTTLCDL